LNIFNADKGIVCTGTAPGASGNNLFEWTVINNIATTAIELTQECDTNSFDFTFIAGLAPSASAIVFNNSDNLAANVGVESNVWRHLIVDAFNPSNYTGTILTFNQSRGTQILSLEVGGRMSNPTYIATPNGSATYTVDFAGNLSNHAYDNVNIGHRNVFHGGALQAEDFMIDLWRLGSSSRQGGDQWYRYGWQHGRDCRRHGPGCKPDGDSKISRWRISALPFLYWGARRYGGPLYGTLGNHVPECYRRDLYFCGDARRRAQLRSHVPLCWMAVDAS
jgi:hypothetical protein